MTVVNMALIMHTILEYNKNCVRKT